MRLTLRTLLAYLDSTLDPGDSDALRIKIENSAFATDLVRRIRAAAAATDSLALPPDAAGPIGDANVMAEYLDSTLTPEQIAEIERACLESDPMLAEAAACHQALTLVLEKKADIDRDLRNRIYGLPGEVGSASENAVSGSFAAVDIPDDPLGRPIVVPGDADNAAVLSEADRELNATATIVPVGKEDSGVSDAPTRIRDMADQADAAGSDAAIAGARPRRLDREFYAGNIRPSRITPWLVSLGVLGLLMFALSKAFEPLLGTQTASRDTSLDAALDPADTRLPSDDKSQSSGTRPGQDVTTTTAVAPEADEVDDQQDPDSDDRSAVALIPVGEAGTNEVPANDAEMAGAPSSTADATESSDENAPPLPPGMAATDAPSDVTAADQTAAVSDSSSAPMLDPAFVEPASTEPDGDPGSPTIAPPTGSVAKVDEDAGETLVAVLGDPSLGAQERVKPGNEIAAGSTLIVPPYFKANLETLPGAKIDLVGPCRVAISRQPDNSPALDLAIGGLVVSTSDPATSTTVEMGDSRLTVQTETADTVWAVKRTSRRVPGLDPVASMHDGCECVVLALRGAINVDVARRSYEAAPVADPSEDEVPAETSGDSGGDEGAESASVESVPEQIETWTVDGSTTTLPEGTTASFHADGDRIPVPMAETPAWASSSGEELSAIQTSARDVLLTIVNSAPDLGSGLRTALSFRRSEVGGLAAEALLLLDQPEVYFGTDGVFNNPAQKRHWERHFDVLTEYMHASPTFAERTIAAITKMESADLVPLSRMLIGFNAKGLADGGDETLVNGLDSPVMAVRALALENLRRISGTTLYFNAAEPNASRRINDYRKWQLRLKKKQIRITE